VTLPTPTAHLGKQFGDFITTMKAQLAITNISFRKFLTTETYLGGTLFSFKDHEFQDYVTEIVENNIGGVISVAKCSQIGLSEIFNRIILARMAVRPRTSALISFPSKSFSQEVLKTRFASVIRESPAFRSLINYNNDSASVKEFYNGSIMYALGGSTQSVTTLLNRPIDTILVDERDRQDPDIISGYESRMTHTPEPERLVINISTPTVPDIGIDAEIKESEYIHTPWIGCPCGHEFIGDFYEHIRLPGLPEGQSLQTLTKTIAAGLNIDEAYLECPECKISVTKENKSTVWKIVHNPVGVKKKVGITIDPFAAMGFITIPGLVRSSLNYTSHVEFLNQGLGRTADKSDSSIDLSALTFTRTPTLSTINSVGLHIFGLDLGKTCYFLHGLMRPDTTVHVLDPQIVLLSDLKEFLAEQYKRYTFAAGVMDSQPYSDLVYALVKKYPRLFSAIYVSPVPAIPEMYRLKMIDKYNQQIRQVTINKSVVMDSFAGSLLDFYSFESGPLDAAISKHFTDMRRVRDYRFNEMVYKWVKSSKGEDHFWHTAVYMFMASKLALAGLNTSAAIPAVVRKINPDKLKASRRGRRL
jgi:hypothetical protein